MVFKTLIPTMPQTITVEAVSSAMKDYFMATYNMSSSIISLAETDIPSIIPAQKVKAWHSTTRQELGIGEDRYVYCYAGSAKTWQCPQEIIDFFIKARQAKPESYLLLLTQDTALFEQLCNKAQLSPQDYTVLHVPHDQLVHYLSAADAGLIFREKHILNWVSRPTKILEYRSVGLTIIHNNTVEMLCSSLVSE